MKNREQKKSKTKQGEGRYHCRVSMPPKSSYAFREQMLNNSATTAEKLSFDTIRIR